MRRGASDKAVRAEETPNKVTPSDIDELRDRIMEAIDVDEVVSFAVPFEGDAEPNS